MGVAQRLQHLDGTPVLKQERLFLQRLHSRKLSRDVSVKAAPDGNVQRARNMLVWFVQNMHGGQLQVRFQTLAASSNLMSELSCIVCHALERHAFWWLICKMQHIKVLPKLRLHKT